MSLSDRALNVVGSITLEIDALAKSLKAKGEDVVGFGAGEPDFDTPQYIKDAAKEALDMGLTKYTPAAGSMDLRKAICDKFKADNNLFYKPNQIIVSNGAKHSLFNALQAIVNPGDEVIVPLPFWVSYPEMVKMAGGVNKFVKTTEANGFVPKACDIEKMITPKTKAIIINSPSNPCGGVYSLDDLKEIAELAKKHKLYVVSDEIYEELIYDGEKHISIASIDDDIKDLTIVVNGFSKAYAMTGWRLGYLAANEEIAKAISNFQSHSASGPNTMAQYAAVAALKAPKDQVHAMRDEFEARRKLLCDKINAIDGLSCFLPKGAFYVMLNIKKLIGKSINGKKINSSMDFAKLLLDKYLVAVVPGVAFGDDNYVRLSYAISQEKLIEGMDRIANFVKSVQ